MSQVLDRLIDLKNSDEYPMHMPGHKRNIDNPSLRDVAAVDITEIAGYDDLYEADGMLRRAMDRAARVAHSDESWLLVNGSTVGILTAISSVAGPGEKILVARNCHKSVYHAIEIRGLEADFIYPEIQDDLCQPVNPDEIEVMLGRSEYRAVVITSPTYEGIVSDIEEIARVCHSQGVVLIVDEAHGAHFGYHQGFPKSAIMHGDIVIQSLHKTLPALTQTGLLHINGNMVDREKVRRYLQIYQTSSPSYVLMASIDECMEQIEKQGSSLWENFFRYREEFDNRLKDLEHMSIIRTDDPCKIVISTRGTSITGQELSGLLLSRYHIQMEMAGAAYAVAIVTCNDTSEGFDRLARALAEIDTELTEGEVTVDYSLLYGKRLQATSIDNALRNRVQINLKEAVGKICSDYIMVYPPGIPYIVPGEIIAESTVEALEKLKESGLQVRGISDGKIYVMKR